MKGIDISEFQEGLKLSDAKKSGYEFAIIRAGWTGYGASRSKNKDVCFEGFYKQAKELGFPVGAYWYSCANTRETGEAEAKFLYEYCLAGKKFEFPIYIDIEDVHWQTENPNGVTDAILGFCDFLAGKGFYAGVYSSTWWFDNYIDTSRIKALTKWVAQWSANKPQIDLTNFDIWQNSEVGRVSGYNGNVDTDYSYTDLTAYIKANGLNGFTAEKKKTIDELAQEVIAGKWGAGEDRFNRLTAAGYDADKVQERVNEILLGKSYVTKSGETLEGIAKANNTTVAEIIKKNSAIIVRAGQKIRL